MEKTCIRFEPYTDALARQLGHNNYIEFHNDNGCYSMVGMQGSGAQWVSLERPGCMYHQVGKPKTQVEYVLRKIISLR